MMHKLLHPEEEEDEDEEEGGDREQGGGRDDSSTLSSKSLFAHGDNGWHAAPTQVRTG